MLFRISLLVVILTGSASVQAQPVVHIVLLWLKQPGDSAQRQQLIQASQRLRQIPGIQRLQLGEAVTSERDIVDDSFDVALVFTFEDETAMKSYLIHPLHKKIVKQDIKPLVLRLRVHDFTDVSGEYNLFKPVPAMKK